MERQKATAEVEITQNVKSMEDAYMLGSASAKKNGADAEMKRAIETKRKLSIQDDEMWAGNEGISQLEGRIETNHFQG